MSVWGEARVNDHYELAHLRYPYTRAYLRYIRDVPARVEVLGQRLIVQPQAQTFQTGVQHSLLPL